MRFRQGQDVLMQPFDGAEPADARLLGIDGIGSEAAGRQTRLLVMWAGESRRLGRRGNAGARIDWTAFIGKADDLSRRFLPPDRASTLNLQDFLQRSITIK